MASDVAKNGSWTKPGQLAVRCRMGWLAAALVPLLLAGGCEDKESPYASSPGRSHSLRSGNTVLGYGRDYLLVMLWGLLPFALCNAYASTLKESGETFVPMAAGVAA